MGSWRFKNVGASAKPEQRKHVEKIFEYIGIAEKPAWSAGAYDECIFSDPDVYGCMESKYAPESGNVKECFGSWVFNEMDLLYLLNALFPGTSVYVHWTEGSTVTDTWEFHDRIYDAGNMTLECKDTYTSYGGWGPNCYESWKERCALSAPDLDYVNELINLSTADGNGELTALLLVRLQKLKTGLIEYPVDEVDHRKVGQPFDVRKREWNSAWDMEKDIQEENRQLHEEKMRLADEARQEAIRNATANLNNDAEIVFADKHFVLSGFGLDDEQIISEIKKRGGIVHSKMVKKADYLVINMGTPGTAKLREALMWRESGSTCSIVSEYQLMQALEKIPPIDPEMLRQREAEALQLKAEKQTTIQRTAQDREQARRQRWEEKQRQAEEARRLKDAERRQKYEAKQQSEEEKRRQQTEKAKARAEQQRLAEEAKAQKEQARQEAAANAVILYAPGEEPENLRKRLNTLFEKLDGAYPDKKISRLYQDHKKWGETVTELYRLLGYPDSQSFLEAYGYTVEKNAGGRPSSVDPVAIMEELRHRYPNGGTESMDTLKNENPDIPWKTLANNAREYYGATLVAYLKKIGILGKPGNKAVGSDSMVDAMPEAVNRSEEVKQVSASAETEPSLSAASTESDEDSWIQAIAAETPLQDEEVLYLRTIHQLFQSAETVRMIDVAKRLGQGTGKVSYWMKKLREKSILDTTSKGVITMLKP